MMQDNHIFQGMRRDNHPIRQEKQFLWDAHNIRLTTRDDNTMLSITNEKSTDLITSFEKGEIYIGHSVIGDYLILLTTGLENDRIYRINLGSGLYTKEILYEGKDLNFQADHPAQMISDYESELVQKVYWVDGYNSPRVMNVAKPELTHPDKPDNTPNSERVDYYNQHGSFSGLYTDHPFDFVQDLELNEDVSIERLQSSVGIFPSGVIQYAMTYFHKYGQESNIFYVSEPLYLSYSDRGGSPEDRISTSFKITVKNIDKKFQYIRVYSIIRTSIDVTPTVKRVVDIDITKTVSKENNPVEVSIIDNNTTGDIVDPTYLLYVGGKSVVANCISSKDNTLFLGGISYNRSSIYDSEIRNKDKTSNNFLKMTPAPKLSIASRDIDLPSKGTGYVNQLSKNTLTFKNGETYRLGCRFQYKNGEWSEPIWIDDFPYNYTNLGYEGSKLKLGEIHGVLEDSLKNLLISKNYKKVQALIVLPTYRDRSILAQGILCPTVGQVGNRAKNSGAWAQSSWLLRPWSPTPDGGGYNGAIPAANHNRSLVFGINRAVEIQSMSMTFEDTIGGFQLTYDEMISGKGETNSSKEDSEAFYGAFVVDQSIVNMYSPDIELGDLTNIINSGVELSLHKVGKVKFDKNIGSIDIQTSTPVADPDASGFLKKDLSGDGVNSLISGLFYEDAMLDDQDSGSEIKPISKPRLWMVYMWHRSGSLNNDCVRPEGVGSRTAELKKKSVLNYKDSTKTILFSKGSQTDLEALDIKGFNSNEMSLVKLNIANNKLINYYGNVDTLIPAYAQYNHIVTPTITFQLKNPSAVFSGKALIGGEEKAFSDLRLTGLTSIGEYITLGNTGKVASGMMPYIAETSTVISNSSSAGETSDSSTTVSSTGTKTVIVNITDNATVSIHISNKEFAGTVTLLSETTATDNKTIVPAGTFWSISGKTNYVPQIATHKDAPFGHNHPTWGDITPTFNSPIIALNPKGKSETEQIQGAESIGDNYEALILPKEGVRMKYKTVPHAVIALSNNLTYDNSDIGCLFLAELRQSINEDIRYGGKSEEALEQNLWIPAGPVLNLSDGIIKWVWGDTWFQKYEFLKTYPFTPEDTNQVTEIGSFYCETRVNIDGRYDRNRGSTSFSLSPINFNLINPVYSQLDTFFTSRMLDDDYYKVTDYPSQFLWTGVKTPASDTDIWTNLHIANTYDMDGSNGKLTAIQPFNDILIGFQDKAVSQILFNSRVQIQASDGVPIEIANSQRVEGIRTYSNAIGCQDKFSIVTTPMGIYFMDNNNHNLYKFDGQLNNIGLQLGTLYWARENYWDVTWRYPKQDSKYNGIRLSYDPKYQDVYFTPGADYGNREALCYSEQLGQFTSMMSYGGAVMFPHKSRFYSIAPDPDGIMTLWENFPSDSDSYNNIFGVPRDYGFSFISNDNPAITKIFDTIEMRADCYIPNGNRDDNFGLLGGNLTHVNQTGKPFNIIRVDDEYQDTGEVVLDDTNMRKKFRVWRALIPRKKGSRERIRNPWAKITLGMKNPDTKMTILHDLNVGYTV